MSTKTALITGATAGIGLATATLLAEKKYNLILTGRRYERLLQIKSDLENKFAVNVKTICFDLSERAELEEALASHAVDLDSVSVLINNAGLAKGADPIDQADMDDWDIMIDTNIKGLLFMTRLMLPHLKKHTSAHIINIGSVAGRWVYPGGNVYCATKFAVRAISESLRIDLLGQPIRICNIEPGMVETEFSNVRLSDDLKAKRVYQGMTPLKPEDIACNIDWVLQQPQHVNIQELVVFPTDQASVGRVHRIE